VSDAEPAAVPLLRVVLWHAGGDDAAIMADIAIGEPPGQYHHDTPDDIAATLACVAEHIGATIADVWARVAATRN